MNRKNNWVPEIMYEDPSEIGASGAIPFIPVPNNEKMPRILFIFESRETGEFEPDLNGDPMPIVQMDLRQYASMEILKQNLQPEIYDSVRNSLGLENLKSAAEKGSKVTENIREALT